MKILLVGEFLVSRSFNGANKALPVLASALSSAGFSNVVQLDLERRNVTMDRVCREAVESDLVAFAGCMTPQWPELDRHVKRVHEALVAAGRSDVPLVVGGYATKGVADIARHSPWITGFFDGEGESGIVELAQAVASGQFVAKRSEIKGLYYIDDRGRFVGSVAPRTTSFDHIDQTYGFVHVPGTHDMDIFRGPDGRQLKTAQLFTQRGCPWKCGYCNKSTESNNVVRLSEEALRDQLEKLKKDEYEAIYLDVDTFTVNRRHAEREAELLNEYGFQWGSNTRIDLIDPELMKHFVENGCTYMFFGVEHIDPDVAIGIGKFNGNLQKQIQAGAEYPDQIVRVFRSMRAVGLPSSYFIILGLPKAVLDPRRMRVVRYEPTTFEDDIAAVRFGLDHCDPDYLNLNVLRFMPGSLAADAPAHPAYSCVRPSGAEPITAGYFLPRVAKACGYDVPTNHPVYRLCESVGLNQPTTSALDPQRVFDTVRLTMEAINARIDQGHRPARLFLEKELFEAGLVQRDEAGRYSLAPLREWEGYSGGYSA